MKFRYSAILYYIIVFFVLKYVLVQIFFKIATLAGSKLKFVYNEFTKDILGKF